MTASLVRKFEIRPVKMAKTAMGKAFGVQKRARINIDEIDVG